MTTSVESTSIGSTPPGRLTGLFDEAQVKLLVLVLVVLVLLQNWFKKATTQTTPMAGLQFVVVQFWMLAERLVT